jgi:hypothetical protein
VGRQLLADEEPDEGALAAPDGPTRKTKSPLGMLTVDVGERDLAVRVGHADVDHADDRLGVGRVATYGRRRCRHVAATSPILERR